MSKNNDISLLSKLEAENKTFKEKVEWALDYELQYKKEINALKEEKSVWLAVEEEYNDIITEQAMEISGLRENRDELLGLLKDSVALHVALPDPTAVSSRYKIGIQKAEALIKEKETDVS